MKRALIAAASLSIIVLPLTAQAQVAADSFSTSARCILCTELRRFFTHDALGKAQLTLAIENGLLLKASDEAAAGNTDEATKTLAEVSATRSDLQSQLKDLAADDRATHHLVTDVVSDDAHQLRALTELEKSVDPAKASETEALKDIATTLALPSLTTEDRAIVAAEATSAAAHDESGDSAKVAAKVSLKNKVEDQSGKTEVQDALEHEENVEVSEAAQLNSADLGDFVNKLDTSETPRHNLIVLQKLLNQVPEVAKGGIETALGQQAEQEAQEVEKSTEDIQKLDEASEPAEVRSAVIDRVKSKVTKEDVKNLLDQDLKKAEDDTKKAEEAPGSTNSGSGKDSSDSGKATPTPTSKPSASPTASATPKSGGSSGSGSSGSGSSSSGSGSRDSSTASTPTPSTPTPTASSSGSDGSTSQTSASIRVRSGKLDSSSITVANNSKLTVQFENDDATPAVVTLANGIGSGSVAQNGKVNLQSFTITGPVSFTVTINGTTLNGTINVK